MDAGDLLGVPIRHAFGVPVELQGTIDPEKPPLKTIVLTPISGQTNPGEPAEVSLKRHAAAVMKVCELERELERTRAALERTHNILNDFSGIYGKELRQEQAAGVRAVQEMIDCLNDNQEQFYPALKLPVTASWSRTRPGAEGSSCPA